MLITRAAEFPDQWASAFDNWRIIAAVNDGDMPAPLIEPAPLDQYPAIK